MKLAQPLLLQQVNGWLGEVPVSASHVIYSKNIPVLSFKQSKLRRIDRSSTEETK